ncbi:MAG: hypothetical protein H8E12_22205 [Rhodobacteraceae bacterium]|nr:hypothetical protein [Paracoccaceae bacterium]
MHERKAKENNEIKKRIFSYFALTLVCVFLTGCSTTKWEWLPKDKPPYEIKKEAGKKNLEQLMLLGLAFNYDNQYIRIRKK